MALHLSLEWKVVQVQMPGPYLMLAQAQVLCGQGRHGGRSDICSMCWCHLLQHVGHACGVSVESTQSETGIQHPLSDLIRYKYAWGEIINNYRWFCNKVNPCSLVENRTGKSLAMSWSALLAGSSHPAV